MLTAEQIDVLGGELVPLYQYLEAQVIADIARRIKKTMMLTRTAELQAMQLREIGYSPQQIMTEAFKLLNADQEYQDAVIQNTLEYKAFVAALIKEIEAAAEEAGNTLVANAGEMEWISDMRLWESGGKSLTDNRMLLQQVAAMQRHTSGELKNITRTTGFAYRGTFENVTDEYRKVLDRTLVKALSGTFSRDEAIKTAIHDLANSGMRSISYADGRSYQLDTAARMCVRTGLEQLTANIQSDNIRTMGEPLVYVSQHWGARDKGEGIRNHKEWQGKVYSVDGQEHPEEEQRIGQKITDLEKATGYDVQTGTGNVAGLHGVNCRHQHYVWFEGVSKFPPNTPEPAPKTIGGKEYTYYDMTQRQRALERKIRAAKREVEACEAAGLDSSEAKAALRAAQKEYRDFSKAAGIKTHPERCRVEAGTSDLTKTEAHREAERVRQRAASRTVTDFINPSPNTKLGCVDVTEDTLSDVTPVNQPITDILHFTQGGINYDVDGTDVKFTYEAREKEVGEIIQAKISRVVQMMPVVTGRYKGVKTPDYLISGKRYDLKSLTGTSKNLVYNAVHNCKEQADNFILDVTDAQLPVDEILSQITRGYTSKYLLFVNEIIVIQGQEILRIFKRIS